MAGSPTGRDVVGTAYDEGSKDFYVGFGPQAPLLRWDGSAFVPAGAMPTAFGDATSSLTADGLPVAIRTVPEAGGTFAVAVDWQNEDWRSLWFRPFDKEWTLVANAPELDQLSPGLRFPGPFGDVYVSEDGRAVRILAGGPRQATIHLVRTQDGWRLDGTGLYEYWLRHDPSGVRLSWVGESVQKLTERYLLLFEKEVEPVAPKLNILDPGSLMPRPLSDIEPVAERTGDSVFYFPVIQKVPGIEALLIRAADGWYAFDGHEITAIPSLSVERVGALSDIRQVGPLVLVQSKKGVFRLGKDLVAERVETFPNDEPYRSSVTIEYLAEAGLFIVVSNRETIHVSKDFAQFEKIEAHKPITSVVAQLPDRPGLLLVGSDGLYTLEAECPESNGP